MSAMVDSFAPKSAPFALPHRKPVGSNAGSAAAPSNVHSSLQLVNADGQARSRQPSSNGPPPQPTAAPPSVPRAPPSSASYGGNTNNNNNMNMNNNGAYQQTSSMQQYYPGQPARRTLSNATTSTTSSADAGQPAMKPVRTPSALRRSPTNSLASVPAPTSYVALMRKQKATVWSERAQHEDPRLLAAQRQAKMRAAQEVVGGPASTYYGQRRTGGVTQGGNTSSGTFAGGMRSKIRHHGAQKAVNYKAGPGQGVPMRLSANEVDEEDTDDEQQAFGANGPWHRRTGSGRSSLGSERRFTGVSSLEPIPQMSQAQHHTQSATTGPASPSSPLGEEPAQYIGSSGGHNAATRPTHTKTMSSSSSGGSRENSFGQLGAIPHRDPVESESKRKSTAEDLMRRGSVDERTMTMSGVRLFVANPDLSD